MTKYLDWSKHEVIIEDHGKLKIWRIKIPGTILHQVNFINTEDRLIVTGDYGDWMFSREFWPSAENGVSQGYWLEKLRASMGRREDWELDKEYIRDRIKEFPERYGDDLIPEEVLSWLEDLESNLDDDLCYQYVAYRQKPDTVEYEDVPYSKKIPIQLLIVFEAFDEICRRLSENEKTT
ncbi:MAG: hypothetical protein WC279_11975 [Sulfurimonas sp.]|jgi:hypothetical protein|uniref:hypothetical protein n=1 Tax=Sulfurimonas sp. TaxID=2022749 RepID=UPI0035628A4D